MGVMSRRVVPACGNLCFFCPSLRARSRQPVKRYKKFLADIFPRNQDAEPNDRKIGKLCDYASKNPLRIPKITDYLEQRCYKDLRNGNFGSVKVVLCIYRKLLSSCKEQMSLYANSLLGIVRVLLEQTPQDELRILGCNTLVEFLNSQVDSTQMFSLEGLLPKLFQIAGEVGDDERALAVRSAGMQALASMVQFMSEQSHISMDFDKIISVMLENFRYQQVKSESTNDDFRHLHGQGESEVDKSSSFKDASDKVTSLAIPSNDSGVEPTVDTSKNPSYWSRICLQNIASLAKEATSIRRVLEPLFHNFDNESHWSMEKGLGFSVLMYLQSVLEESGGNSEILLSNLVKHLDHKTVAGKTVLQIDIINVTTQLAHNAKQQASVTIIGAITDLVKQLRKCLQSLAQLSRTGDGAHKTNSDLQSALERCISELSLKVRDIGSLLDMMAVLLESIPNTPVVARSTIYAVYRTAQIISSLPKLSHDKKAFPETLFHQLLLVMAHPDSETRVGAHCILSTVLMPSLLRPLIEAVPLNGNKEEVNQISIEKMKESSVFVSNGKSYSFKLALSDGKPELSSLRLSSHQISLLLSSIWVQAVSAENMPANFEAMAQTYNIALLFTRSKSSNHMVLVRCFQLALSLRSISLDQEGGLQPSRRRSLFTLSTYMLIFSAKAGGLPELIPHLKESLTDKTIDPYLELIEDVRLQAVYTQSNPGMIPYGSQEDEAAALKSLSAVDSDEQQLKETVLSHLLAKSGHVSEDEISNMKSQLLQVFSPDEAYPLGAPLFMETPRPCSPLTQINFEDPDEVMPPVALMDDDVPEPNGSQSDRRTSLSTNNIDIINVNQLLESVLETARQVASLPVSSTPIPYDQMKSQCEALVMGKQQKMSVLHSFKNQQNAKAIILSEEIGNMDHSFYSLNVDISEGDLKLINGEQLLGRNQLVPCSHEYGQNSFRLPPSSPYDKFLKAAGC